MKIEYGPEKSRRNTEKRGLSFDLVAGFDFDSAFVVMDDRHDYGETRYRAIGQMGADIVVVVFTMRRESVRVISLRPANKMERRTHAIQTQQQG